MRVDDRTRTGRGLFKASLLFLIGLNLSSPPDARGGFCAGDGARIRFLFERMTHWADKNMGSAQGQFRQVGHKIVQYLPHFSLWLLHVNSRAALASFLKQAEADPESLPSVKKLASALEPHWNLATDINQHIHRVEIDTKPPLKHITEEIAIFWAICQAIKTVRPEPCELLESYDPKLKYECVSLLIRFGILFTGRCSDENIELVASIERKDPRKVLDFCQTFADKRSNRCRSFGLPIQVAQTCLAMTGQGENACKHPELSEKDSRECLRELHTYQAITGELSRESWERMDPNIMHKAAVYSVLGPSDCLEMALRLYDQFDQFGANFFLMENRPWYQPPGIH